MIWVLQQYYDSNNHCIEYIERGKIERNDTLCGVCSAGARFRPISNCHVIQNEQDSAAADDVKKTVRVPRTLHKAHQSQGTQFVKKLRGAVGGCSAGVMRVYCGCVGREIRCNVKNRMIEENEMNPTSSDTYIYLSCSSPMFAVGVTSAWPPHVQTCVSYDSALCHRCRR